MLFKIYESYRSLTRWRQHFSHGIFMIHTKQNPSINQVVAFIILEESYEIIIGLRIQSMSIR